MLSSTFGESFRIFSKQDRRKIRLVVAIQVIVGLLDLVGVALIGVIGALAITGIQSSSPGNRVSALLRLLHLQSFTFQTQTVILGISATLILVARTIVSVTLTRKSLLFISRRSAVISEEIVKNLFAQDLPSLQRFPVQQTMYSISNGITAITLGVVGNTVNLIADTALLAIMSTGLFVFDVQIAIFSLIFFGSIAGVLYKVMQTQARVLGQKEAEISINTNQLLFESLNSYREIYVKGLRKSYADRISENKFELSTILAKMSFLPSVSKYVIESSIIVGALVVSTFQFMQYDAKHSIATLTVFLAAGSRISPAVLRVQQGLISIKNNLGGAQTTLKLIRNLESGDLPNIGPKPVFNHPNFEPNVSLKGVEFQYHSGDTFQIGPIDLSINAGEVIAIVGASGSGKTTLADLILGAIKPTKGQISISGSEPSTCIYDNPGAIAYVPQDIQIFKGDVISNIAFGYQKDLSFLPEINRALSIAQLTEVISGLPEGLETELGDKGFRLSGGQRQRLGIARAMFTSPKLIVLDEATSALDGKTEDEISAAISKLKGQTTVILIAHRLASVREADSVIYMSNGKILAKGSFEEIKSSVPDFSEQAKLMGL
ncbi:MdlB ABC-type multidrug transport system, ATPase and permease components [Candidatus Nanopelagicaceae bacterium]